MTIPPRRVAAWLWIAFAFLLWNAVFDQVIIDAGRHYVEIATASAGTNGPYLKIEDTMRPARAQALWLASASAGAILVIGFALIRGAGRSGPPRT